MALNMNSFEALSTIPRHTKVEYHIQSDTSNQGFWIHKAQVLNKVFTYHKLQIQTNQKLLVIKSNVMFAEEGEASAIGEGMK